MGKKEIEIEKRFLAKYIPSDLDISKGVELKDIYIPITSNDKKMRIRRKGNTFEITKKVPLKDGDLSVQEEQTIPLTKEEYEAFKNIEGSIASKLRVEYQYKEQVFEFDIFKELLEGIVLIDIEFSSVEEFEKFEVPDFCLCDVTQDSIIGGGKIGGKTYYDLEEYLNSKNYKKIISNN